MLPPIPMMLRMMMEQQQQGQPRTGMPQQVAAKRPFPPATPEEEIEQENMGDDELDTDEMDAAPKEKFDLRFAPRAEDEVRAETERELEATRRTMTDSDKDPEAEADWEGAGTGSPTKADLDYVRENPTDGVLNSFFDTFPKWTAEDILRGGGNPSESPDQYAMDDEEWQETQKDRSTSIDER